MKASSLSAVLLGTTFLFTPLVAAAQDDATGTAAQPYVLETITLTGEKVARSLQDTPSSVTAFSAATIADDVNASSVTQLINGQPNIVYPDEVSAPIIRGQDTQGPNSGAGAFFGGTVPRAKTNVDGHYLSYNEYVFGAASIWDVDSVEVFRGPQTIAQGANSIAGAIIVNTQDPSFTPEGSMRLQYGENSSRRASVAYSAPISEDLSARIALDYSARDTFIDYVNPAFTKGETDQDFESFEARAKILWQPSALPGFEAKLTFSHKDTNRPTTEAASLPYGDLESTTLGMPSWDQRSNTTIADVSYEFDNGIRIVNQLQYTDLFTHRVAEPEANGGAFINLEDLSNETRVTFGDEDTQFSGVVGVFYSHISSDELLYTRGESAFDDKKKSVGVFGEVTYRPTEQWALTAGLRYQGDTIQRSGTTSFSPIALDYEESFHAWLPKLSVAYDVTPDITVGGLVSKGYNPGGVNLSFAEARFLSFDEETATNYELFGRAELLEGRMRLSGNLFYTRYSDSQRVLPDYLNGVVFGNVVVNADDAKSYGLEMAADYQVNDALRLQAGLGLLHTEIGNFVDAEGNSYTGNKFGRAPRHTLMLGAEWEVMPGTVVAGDIRHVGGYHSTDLNVDDYDVGSYTIANARVSHELRDGVKLYAYADNLFDKHAETYKFDDRTAGGIISAMAKPREIGIGLNVDF